MIIVLTQNIDKFYLIGVTDDVPVENVPHVRLIPIDKNTAYGVDRSAIPVKVAHSLFRTYGFDQPSDDELYDFAEDYDNYDENTPAKLRSLYAEPVLFFLKGADDNVVAYYADRGINTIKAYPETHDVLKSLLGSSNAVVLAYRPEKYLYPADRYALANRFFVPKNVKITPNAASTRDTENYGVNDAPVAFLKYEIPSRYQFDSTQYADFDIDKIPYAHKYPVTLKPTETLDFPYKKETIPYSTIAYDSVYAPSDFRKLNLKYRDPHKNPHQFYCSRFPHSDLCKKRPHIIIDRESDDDVSPVVKKPYTYITHVDSVKTSTPIAPKHYLYSEDAYSLCAKYPYACHAYPSPKSTKLPYYYYSPEYTSYTDDYLHLDDVGIKKPYKVIVPKIAYKYDTPYYSEDYVTPAYGTFLKSLVGKTI